MSPITFPIETGRSRLLLKIDSFDLANALDGQALEQMGKSEVCDVTLLRQSDYDGVDRSALKLISHMLFDFLQQNPDNIIYFYCDDFNDLPRSRHNQALSPQEYRSRLFSALFQDETNRHGIDDYLDDVIEFEIEGTKRFIHLIYGIGNAGKAEVFKNAITELCAKP